MTIEDLSPAKRIQFEAELNEFIDALDTLDPRVNEDAEWEAMADEHEEIEFGMAVMGA